MSQHTHLKITAQVALGLVALCAGASAQQLLRNTTDIPGSTGLTENVDFGDVDNDGDWDALFGNGGDTSQQQDVLWTNNGGVQAGVVGVFTNVTATQLPAVLDQTRDVEFVDFDNDGDIDAYISNTSQIIPQTNRWWRNNGPGIGTIGFFVDETAARWSGLGGAGSSIGPGLLVGGGFQDWSCDCDFGDLDNDGDLDLVHSSYGGAFGGQVPTRLFLNNGAGVFSEFNPSGFQIPSQNIVNGNPGIWCQGTQSTNTTNSTGVNCDVASSALDIDVGDIDGDLDLDILHGARQELPRMFQNRLQEQGSLAFRDVTGAVFPAGYSVGDGHYEQEMGDMDGDGDWDIYGLNWQVSGGFNDVVMKNNAAGVYGSLAVLPGSGSDDNEGDFIDYDNDGDLDLFIANFSGQDRMYNNNGSGTYAFIATNVAIPSDGTTSLDADMADVDNDGDSDIFVANDANQAEWYLKNGTAANDTTAPSIVNLEQAPNRFAGPAPTVVRVHVYDNASYYNTWYHPTSLKYTVNAGPVQTVVMQSSQGQVFRGLIPGNVVGTIAYHVESQDQYGNAGSSVTKNYISSDPAPGTSFCWGDGSLPTPCPCALPNTVPSPSGAAGHGCANTFDLDGAILSATGTLTPDTIQFTCVVGGNYAAFALLLKGNASNPTGSANADGVLCVSGALLRFGAHNAATGGAPLGTWTLPNTIQTNSISAASLQTPGETAYYQLFYRNAQPNFCTAATANWSNAYSLAWP